MRMTLKDVKKNLKGLIALGGATLPSKLSFAISRNIEKLQAEERRAEDERSKLCEQYSDKDKDGNPVMTDCVIEGLRTQKYEMSPENQEAFNQEYEDLMNEEVDIDIRMVKLECIEQCEKAERYTILSVGDIAAMSFMIEE